MKKTLLFKSIAFFAILALIANASQAQVKITEVMSSSGTNGTADWFELTNLGITDVDITGWKMDDSSFALATAYALNGVTSIPAGKSVIFLESSSAVTDIATFKTFWGLNDNVLIGTYTGSQIGLSSSNDGVIIFDGSGVEVNRVSFAAATTGSTFYWLYDKSAPSYVLSSTGVSTVGTVAGVTSSQITITSVDALGNIGSPGTAVVGGLTSRVDNPIVISWKLEGNTLRFAQLPQTNVVLFSVDGKKVADYLPASNIELKLKKGAYILRVENQSTKIMLQ